MIWPDDLLSIILATVLGAAVGLEREVSGKSAGLRTNLLICLGAAVFTIISRDMATGNEGSVTRIAAQIVTGVGFLGAGAIINRGDYLARFKYRHGLRGTFLSTGNRINPYCNPRTDGSWKSGQASG